MDESDLHRDCMRYVTHALERPCERNEQGDVWVSANSFLYCEQDNQLAFGTWRVPWYRRTSCRPGSLCSGAPQV